MSKQRTTEEFIEEANKVHNSKYDYSMVDYKKAKVKVKIICPIHGIFEQIPNSHLGGSGCPICGDERTASSKRMSQKEFINRVKGIYPQYDYSKVNYINARTKISLICPEHGEFQISPNFIFSKIRPCPKCSKMEVHKILIKKTTEQFIRDARKIHGDKYDYSLVDYNGTHEKVKIICPIHGVFEQVAKAHLKGNNCPRCHISHGEERILMWLNNHGYVVNQDYITQKHFKELGRRSYDFYIPSKNLLIEYNGKQHYQLSLYNYSPRKLKLQRHSDWLKRKFARDNRIELLTIPYTEFDNIESILENKIGTLG